MDYQQRGLSSIIQIPIIRKLIQRFGLGFTLTVLAVPVAAATLGAIFYKSRLIGSSKSESREHDIGLRTLPNEVLVHMFGLLNEKDLESLSLVCKQFHELIGTDEQLWKSLFRSRWPKLASSQIEIDTNWRKLFLATARDEKTRLTFQPYKYILGIHYDSKSSQPNQGTWADRFRTEIAEMGLGVHLNENSSEITHDSGKVFGRYRFISADDASLKFPNAPWLHRTVSTDYRPFIECPYIGPCVGYLNFEFAIQEHLNALEQSHTSMRNTHFIDIFHEMIRGFCYEARGHLARMDNYVFASSVQLTEFSLAEAFTKYGIHDGDALLDSDINSEYIQSIIKEARQLVEGRRDTQVFAVNTTHNPLRIQTSDTDGLDQVFIKIWTCNFDMARDAKLFGWMK